MAQQGGYAIEEIYRGVISDVVNQVREAFLDEGVDIEVLQQLKKTWETKIQASGAVDLEGRRTPVAPPHLAARQSRQQLPSTPNNIVPKGTTLAQPPPLPENIAGTSQPHAQQQQQPSQTFMNSQNPVQLLSLPAQMLASTSGMQFQSGIIPGTQYAIVDGPNGAPSLVLLNPQVQLSLETQAQFLLQQPNSGNPIIRHPTPNIATKKEPKNVPQLDGGASSPQKNNAKQTANKEYIKKNSNKKLTQLDGGGPGMTDSSSEEEQEAEHSLNRYAGLEDDESAEKAEEVEEEEEEPLNSDDDQSDDEDLETLFDADNIVVCQFEKVHRARNKWKFILKDGVMQVKGKDYCFHKGVGEAEW